MFTFSTYFEKLQGRIAGRIDPVRDWIVIVTISVFVLIGILVWNAWAFDTIASGGTLGDAMPNARSSGSTESFEAIRKVFETRKEEESKYVTGVYRFADPSE